MKAREYLESLLEPLGIPLAYKKFKSYKGKPAPDPPYIAYYIGREVFDGGDMKNLYKELYFTIELFTKEKNSELENKIEAALNGFRLEKSEDYYSDEQTYTVTYELKIIEKLRR